MVRKSLQFFGGFLFFLALAVIAIYNTRKMRLNTTAPILRAIVIVVNLYSVIKFFIFSFETSKMEALIADCRLTIDHNK